MIRTARDLLDFATHLELSTEFVKDVTGININRYRRGKLKGEFSLTENAQEKLARLESLYLLGMALFSDNEKAINWLYEETPALAGSAPIDSAETQEAFQKVRMLVEAIVGSSTLQPPPTVKIPDTLPTKARVAEGLKRVFQENPSLTQAMLAKSVQSGGLEAFSQSRLSRLFKGYADATANEIMAIAKALNVPTSVLLKK